jgi:hypothetical protein
MKEDLFVNGEMRSVNGHFHKHISEGDPATDMPSGEGYLECLGECPGGPRWTWRANPGVMVRVLDETFWGAS